MSFENPHRPRRRGPSALAVTSLALAAGAAAVVAWLALTAGDGGDRREPAAVVRLAPEPAPAAPASRGAPSRAGEVGPETVGPAVEAPAPDAPEAVPAPRERRSERMAAPEPRGKTAAPRRPEPGAPDAARRTAQAAPRALPETAAEGLRPAPDPDLIEKTRLGPLPRVADDGRKPWQVYARPFDVNDQRPRISVIVHNLGLSGAATEAAIQRLPGEVTLAFAPYAKGLDQWIALARAAGHEVLLDLPMEPVNFPANDPGPHTLLTSLTESQNMTRLRWLLGRVTGYVGVVNFMGSRFTTSKAHLRPVLEEIERRGLLFVDSRASLRSVAARTATEIGLPRVINNRFIDAEANREAIDARLAELERIARVSGFAVGIGSPFPVTIDRLARWTRALAEKKLALAPVSAMVNAQPN